MVPDALAEPRIIKKSSSSGALRVNTHIVIVIVQRLKLCALQHSLCSTKFEISILLESLLLSLMIIQISRRLSTVLV